MSVGAGEAEVDEGAQVQYLAGLRRRRAGWQAVAHCGSKPDARSTRIRRCVGRQRVNVASQLGGNRILGKTSRLGSKDRRFKSCQPDGEVVVRCRRLAGLSRCFGVSDAVLRATAGQAWRVAVVAQPGVYCAGSLESARTARIMPEPGDDSQGAVDDRLHVWSVHLDQ